MRGVERVRHVPLPLRKEDESAAVLGGNSTDSDFGSGFRATFWADIQAIFCPIEMGMELQ